MTLSDSSGGVAFYQLAARKAALSLEVKGLHRSAGKRTAYSICREAYGLHGSRASVLNQMQALVDRALAAHAPATPTST